MCRVRACRGWPGRGLRLVRDLPGDAEPVGAGTVGTFCPNGDVVTARAGGFPVGDEYCPSGGARAGGAGDCVPVGIMDAQDLQLRGLEPLRQAGLGPEPDGVLLTLLVLQLQKCGEEFQAASVMAAPGRCLVPPSPPGPPQH